MRLLDLAGKTCRTLQDEGARATARKIVHFLSQEDKRHAVLPDVIAGPKDDVCGRFAFVLGRIRVGRQQAGTPEPRTINWFVPDLGGPGAGGHVTICRCIRALTNLGFHCRIYFCNTAGGDTRVPVRRFFDDWYRAIAGDVEICSAHFDEIVPAEAAFATSWQTAYLVRGIRNARKKFYFVQDYEPWFFAHGSEYAFAENTYKFGFVGITASPWLKLRMERYGMRAHAFGFSYNQEVYYPRPRRDAARKQVLVYTRPYTARRAFELAMLACWQVKEQLPDVHLVFVGSNELAEKYTLPFPYEDMGIATPEELADAYSQSDICVALSCSNVSLLPLEIMGCRSVVLTNDEDQVRWLQNGGNSLLTPMDPAAIAKAITDAYAHPEKLEQLRVQGYEYAKKTSWDREFQKVGEAVKMEMEEMKR